MFSALKENIDRKWKTKVFGKQKTSGAQYQQTLKRKSQSENRWVFRRLRSVAEESASLIVCGRAFQSLGAELEKALKPSCFLAIFLFFVFYQNKERCTSSYYGKLLSQVAHKTDVKKQLQNHYHSSYSYLYRINMEKPKRHWGYKINTIHRVKHSVILLLLLLKLLDLVK